MRILGISKGGQGCAEGGELGVGVVEFLAFAGHHSFGGVVDEAFVGELFLDGSLEAFVVLDVLFDAGFLRLDVGSCGHGHVEFAGAHHEALRRGVLFSLFLDGLEAGELGNGAFKLATGEGSADHAEAEAFLGGDVLVGADGADSGDDFLGGLHLGEESGVGRHGLGHGGVHDALALAAVGQMLPELFGDEGHEGMEHAQEGVEVVNYFRKGAAVDGRAVCGLDHLEVPGGELVAEETVDRHEGFGDSELGEEVVDFGDGGGELAPEPFGGHAADFGLFESFVHAPALDEAEGVPDFVAEVAALLHELVVVHDVVAGGGGEHQAHADAVGAIVADEVEGVGRVAERLAHLAADGVADDACEVNVVEGLLAHVFIAGHDHAGHPEEDDVRTGDERGRGVVVVDFLVAGVVDAVEEGDGPEPGGEPGVERVLVLSEVGIGQAGAAGEGAGLGESFLAGGGHDDALLAVGGGGEVVGGDAVAPPELAADAPVLDVLEPDAVGVLVLLGHEADDVIHHRGEAPLGEVLHVDKPLEREARLDGDFRALGGADLVGVVLDFLEESGGLEVLGDFNAAVEAVHADVHSRGLGHGAVLVEDVDGLEVVGLAEHVVVLVVCGSDLQTARAEVDFNVAVLDYGHHAADKGHDYTFALEPCVLGVLGVDAHGGVAHDGLGTGRGDHGIASFGVVGHVVAQVVELALLLDEEHLVVADGRAVRGVPVDHAEAAVDEALVVKVAEHLCHGLGALGVHGEGRAVPVAGCAELAELLEDYAAVLLGPFPGVLEEFLAGEVGFLYAFRGEFGDDLGLGGDGGVVGAGYPEGVLALHAGAAHEDVLDGVVEHVAHMEHTRDVWRGNYYGVRFTGIGHGTEELVFEPVGIPFVLHFRGIVLLWEFVAHI